MYFAHGDINGYDFWGEAKYARWSSHSASTFGRTVFRKLDEMRGGTDSGALRAEFDLVTPDGRAFAAETQAYIFRGDDQVRIIDCEFTIRADYGPVRMGDTKERTFAIRLVKGLEPPAGHIVNSEGAASEKAIWGRGSLSTAAVSSVGGRGHQKGDSRAPQPCRGLRPCNAPTGGHQASSASRVYGENWRLDRQASQLRTSGSCSP